MTSLLTGWRRLRKAESAHTTTDPEMSLQAIQDAQDALLAEQCKASEATRQAARMREFREKNHWSDMFVAAMQPGSPRGT